jgi:hypothetical protein
MGYDGTPYLWGGRNYVSSTTEGTHIDLIDAKKKELVGRSRRRVSNSKPNKKKN